MKSIFKHLSKILFVIICIILANYSVVFAAKSLENGYYMIECGNNNGLVLDINNNSMENGGNLEVYNKNTTTNQIFYVQYNSDGYYSIQALHSGLYLHRKENNNVHQWTGYGHSNSQWTIGSVGGGYYGVQNRNGGYFLDNYNANTKAGNNVWVYPLNKSYAQRWKFIKVEKPAFTASAKHTSHPNGSFKAPRAITVKGTVSANYPVTKIQYGVFYSSGKLFTGNIETVKKKRFSFSKSIDVSGIKPGDYFYGLIMYDIWGDKIQTARYDFSIKAEKPAEIIKSTTVENNSKKRQTVVNYMRSMAQIRWTPSISFTHWSGGRKWLAGTYYRGIPYSQSNRNTTYKQFVNKLKGGKYIGPSGKKTYLGTDCSSSVSLAWKQVDPKFTIRSTLGLQPGNSKVKKVGTYNYYSSFSNKTKKICTTNGKVVMSSSYSCLLPGDAVVKRNDGSGHAMLVASIDISKGSIKMIEQTVYDNKLKSTWRVNEEYSYDSLYAEGYIPVKLSTM